MYDVPIPGGVETQPYIDSNLAGHWTSGSNGVRVSMRPGYFIFPNNVNQQDDSMYNIPYLAVTKINDTLQLLSRTLEITIQAGVYQPNDLAELITRQLQKPYGGLFVPTTTDVDGFNFQAQTLNNTETTLKEDKDVVMMNAEFAKEALFSNKIATNTSGSVQVQGLFTYRPIASGDNQGNLYQLGAPNAELSFDGNNFALKFLHTPLMLSSGTDQSKPPYDNMGISVASNNQVITRLSGVYLQGLSPASFWDKIGFTQTSVNFITDDTIKNLPSLGLLPALASAVNGCSTEQYFSADATRNKEKASAPLASFNNSGFQQYGLPDEPINIKPLDSYQSDRVGYYLLSTVANFETDFRYLL